MFTKLAVRLQVRMAQFLFDFVALSIETCRPSVIEKTKISSFCVVTINLHCPYSSPH